MKTMTKKRIIVIGYGFNGGPALRSIVNSGHFEVPVLITPPMVKGRYRVDGKELESEVFAKSNDIQIVQTNDNKRIEQIIKKEMPDVVGTFAYNMILQEEILRLGPYFLNLHHGDLPRWRGSSNTEWAIITGRNEITMTLHETATDLDAGNIWWQARVEITEKESIVDMRQQMNDILEKELGDVLYCITDPEEKQRNDVRKRKQEGEPTYTVRISKGDTYIDWSRSTREIYNWVRALCAPGLPQPYTFYKGKQIDVWSAEPKSNPPIYEGRIPGRPVARNTDGSVEVLTGDGSILLYDVYTDGQRMKAAEAITSTRVTLGINNNELMKRLRMRDE